MKLEYPLYIYPCLPYLKVKLSVGFSTTPVNAGFTSGTYDLHQSERTFLYYCLLCVFFFFLLQTFFSHEIEACKLIKGSVLSHTYYSAHIISHWQVLSRNTQGMLTRLAQV